VRENSTAPGPDRPASPLSDYAADCRAEARRRAAADRSSAPFAFADRILPQLADPEFPARERQRVAARKRFRRKRGMSDLAVQLRVARLIRRWVRNEISLGIEAIKGASR
jgi:hypothetical protein